MVRIVCFSSDPLRADPLIGECKKAMATYLTCIKKVKGVNEDQCRELAKSYLSCRMDRNLMAKDDFKNLGFQDPNDSVPSTKPDGNGT